MLDIKYIREHAQEVQKASKDKKVEVDIAHILEIDKKRQELQKSLQSLQEKRNSFAKSIRGKPTDEQVEEGKKIKENLEKEEKAFNALQEEIINILMKVPNVPDASVPTGKDESENVEVRKWGTPKEFKFKVRDHVEIGKIINGIDVETSSLVAGARFSYLKGDVALLDWGPLP